MINEILLRRKNKVMFTTDNLVAPWKFENNDKYVCTIMKNIECLGYAFSKDLYNLLCTYPVWFLKELYLDLVPILKNMVGADVEYHPMYPNFPQSVMEKDEFELYINAILHYWSFGTLYPYEEKKERLPLFEETKVKVLEVGTDDDLREIFNNLCMSKTSLSQQDKEDLVWIIKNRPYDFPDNIPLKENVALIGKLYIENSGMSAVSPVRKYFKTATDVLRLITAMSDGDISLASNSKFRNLKKRERRMIMDLLNHCTNIEEDMKRYKNKWVRVGEKLYPGTFDKCKYERVINAFYKIRNNVPIETFNGKVVAACKVKDFNKALNLLVTRPGELARNLVYIVRNIDNPNDVINAFKNVASNVSTTVLLQVRQHFMDRDNELTTRVFFPKGQLARSWAMDNNLPDIEAKYCKAIVQICENALVQQYSKRDFLGNVYLSESFKNYVVPFSQRSASKSLKTIVRGSRIPIDKDVNFIRGFIWWTNTESQRVDLDLSATFFDQDWNYKTHISYTNLRERDVNAVHSGDITNGGDVDGCGVAEFLDIDICDMKKHDIKYIVFQVYGFSCPGFHKMEHAMFGWMNRQDVNSGEIFDPKTVEQKMDLTSESVVCIPVIFDCDTKEFIWCDMNIRMDSSCYHNGGNNVESNIRGVIATCYAMVNISKPTLYDLILLNVKARGVMVDNKEDADIIFDIDDGITPYDTDVFMGEYL